MKDSVFEERLVADCPRDPHDFLVNDAAGADILVTDLTVSHHAIGQPDIFARCVNQDVRVFRHQRISDGGFRLQDRIGVVPFRMRVLSPAVTNNQDYRFSSDFRQRTSLLVG